MNIAYACNEAYMEQTVVSVLSLLQTNSKVPSIVIYFIDMGTTNESRAYLNDVVSSFGRQFIIIPFMDIAYDLKVKNTGRHIESVYAKLFFGRINGIDRILYIDSDTVIVDDLTDYYETNLDGYYCAGVLTLIRIEDTKRIGIGETDKAFNDGVLLINLKLWRNDNVLEKCKDFIARYDGEPPVLSEGTINNVCKERIKVVNPRYNLSSGFIDTNVKKIEADTGRTFYSQSVLDNAVANPAIIHFLSGFYNRPWCIDCTHPMKDEYIKYRKKTKWKNQPLLNKKLPLRIKIIGFTYKYLPIWLFCFIRKVSRLFRKVL